MHLLKIWLALFVYVLSLLYAKGPYFQRNLEVIPVVEAATNRAFELHRYIYSLFWLKRRIAYGDEKYFAQIPQISFFMDPHYYEAKVSSFWIDLKPNNLKSVNITINVPMITSQIEALENQAQERRVQLRKDVNQNGETNGMSAAKLVGGKQDPKIGDNQIDHYYYYLQAEYHCVIPPEDSSTSCGPQHYLLDAIYIQIYPVSLPDENLVNH